MRTLPFLTNYEQKEAHNKKILAIKMYRERTGAGLKEAKEEVEQYLLNPSAYDNQRLEAKSGNPAFNHSSYDAYMRIMNARNGSFIDAHEEYLVALAKHLKEWHCVTVSEIRRLRKKNTVVKSDEKQLTSFELLQRALNQKRRYTHRDLKSLSRGMEKHLCRLYSDRLLTLGHWECVMRESEIILKLPYTIEGRDGVEEMKEYVITL